MKKVIAFVVLAATFALMNLSTPVATNAQPGLVASLASLPPAPPLVVVTGSDAAA